VRRKIKFNHIYDGDARILASKLPDRSISVTITPPPYWDLKNYGVENQIGWGQNFNQYMDDIVAIFHHIYRATKESGSFKDNNSQPRHGEIIIYSTDDKEAQLEVKLKDETVWLAQKQIAELFKTERSVITRHLNNIFNNNELARKRNVQKMHIPY